MAKIAVYYDEIEIGLIPTKMLIYFGTGNIRWDKSFYYIPLEAPFKRYHAEDFTNECLSMTVTQGDLTINPERPNQFGIYIPHIVKRMEKFKKENKMDFDYDEVEQFILQIEDIAEVLEIDVFPFYRWSN
jgi:hypothetical protein